MLDRIDAGTDRAFGSLGAMRVGSSAAIRRVCLINERVHLVLRQLRRIDVVVERENAAGAADLDHVRT